jgi:ribosomal protein S18 acetylase RimI-like enzyme
MNLNFTIKNISGDQLEAVKFNCANCTFWLDRGSLGLIGGISAKSINIWELLKSKFFGIRNSNNGNTNFINSFSRSGGIIKAAFSNQKCIGILMAGKYYLFPRLKLYKIFPPDSESMFLGCLYVLPEYRNLGAGKKLLMSLEKDLIVSHVNSIESMGKRLSDDMDIDEYINSPIIPVKFLIKNGFYIKKNDELFPLFRIDLSALSLVRGFLKGKFDLKNLALKRAVKSPATIRKSG